MLVGKNLSSEFPPLLRMRTSCSRMAFWSDSLQQLSEIAVTV